MCFLMMFQKCFPKERNWKKKKERIWMFQAWKSLVLFMHNFYLKLLSFKLLYHFSFVCCAPLPLKNIWLSFSFIKPKDIHSKPSFIIEFLSRGRHPFELRNWWGVSRRTDETCMKIWWILMKHRCYHAHFTDRVIGKITKYAQVLAAGK